MAMTLLRIHNLNARDESVRQLENMGSRRCTEASSLPLFVRRQFVSRKISATSCALLSIHLKAFVQALFKTPDGLADNVVVT